MNLRSIDLNLLVILDALLAERQVTRAGQRIGLTQPAVSNALGRLRYVFKDEILMRTPLGMELTPRAKGLACPIRQILQQIEELFVPENQFDSFTSDRRFTLRMSDLTELLLLPPLLRNIRGTAPHIRMNVMHLNADKTVEALDSGRLDMAVCAGLDHPDAISSQVLFQDRLVCVLSRRHPDANRPLTLERFAALDFLNVSINPVDSSLIDTMLADMRFTRRIAFNVPHWLVVPSMLEALPLAVIMSERHALSLGDSRLAIRELPLDLEPVTWTLYWHRRYDNSVAHEWLRNCITDVVDAIQPRGVFEEASAVG
ncbi:LysR family transcriptional regulator [Burkholderia pseudomallei]|uniref:LysR family transcriptional regulator n=1 Tax=Burkholderia pseudomallei TaxID=28450 RepID=UPI0005E6E64A|nr:LysR family transcriptional regulator [Burkholderia pseudomallei]MBF3381725.1 LysR family transcriptional regulator [Burkholderia pseudomallei]MBF3406035.1 LysR family transcriptional regulator [Burkholderia pseudomallei]ONA41716.1 LysR family transcriptional regulator [Burkholderia pseudomallei]CAJ3057584.1 LysR family transcriptional regulator [Burkholderia pseudomallei]CAJ7183167.1 LysR family transcriptional regulator [Burkholderia pseudomallei]